MSINTIEKKKTFFSVDNKCLDTRKKSFRQCSAEDRKFILDMPNERMSLTCKKKKSQKKKMRRAKNDRPLTFGI